MNTFLPYKSFKKSAKCLDYKRLGKQRVESWQIYNILRHGTYKDCICGCSEVYYGYCVGCYSKAKKVAWYNHPAVKMWQGYELALLEYGYEICKEWIKRGYKDTLLLRFAQEIAEIQAVGEKTIYPKWLGNRKFHRAMRSNLLRKDHKYYSQFGWKVKDNLPYIWGFQKEEEKMSKYTKPWKVCSIADNKLATECYTIANEKLKEVEANKRLIASAPELLEALKNLVFFAPQFLTACKNLVFLPEGCGNEHIKNAVETAKQAIAKAEGK